MSNWQSMVEDRFPGAEIAGERPLAGDASTRRYVRLDLRGGGAPATAVVMILPEPTPSDEPELPYLNVDRHLAACGVAVPETYAARDRDLGALLLEDVGDRALAGVLAAGDTSPAEVLRLLRAVADLLRRLASCTPTDACIAYRRSHDEALVHRELAMISSHGLAESDDGPARPADADPEARAALARLGDDLLRQPRRLMHRDFHGWNLHVDPAGALRLLDFQDAMLGPPAYDLASFCTDRDSDRFIDAERERWLLDRTADALTGLGVYASPEAFRRDYWTAVAFRTLRVIGRFRQLAIENGDRRYLGFVPRMARQTRRALDERGDASLARLLAARSSWFA